MCFHALPITNHFVGCIHIVLNDILVQLQYCFSVTLEKMNVVLLTVVAVVTVAAHSNKPCSEDKDNVVYDDFLNRHIFTGNLESTNVTQWQSYLDGKQLTGDIYRRTQSFIHEDKMDAVLKICQSGLQVNNSNLCISEGQMNVFEVQLDKNAKRVQSVQRT